jgi:hypothetical protein
VYSLPNTNNLQSNLDVTLNPFKSDEVMIPVNSASVKEVTTEKNSNTTGITILGMDPITASIVGIVLFLGIGIGTLLIMNHHSSK